MLSGCRHGRNPAALAAIGSTGEATDAHTARCGWVRLRALRWGVLPARGRAWLRTGCLYWRGIVRATRRGSVFRCRISSKMASGGSGPRHGAPCWLVPCNSVELRATVSDRFADRAVPGTWRSRTQRGQTHEAKRPSQPRVVAPMVVARRMHLAFCFTTNRRQR